MNELFSWLKTWEGWFLQYNLSSEGRKYEIDAGKEILHLSDRYAINYVVAVTLLHSSFIWAGILHPCLLDSSRNGDHGAYT